ncbi:MAG: RluA family pseudouridine synthase [Clostridia bacterium]|nr:RluA family pseudouridine synthase [Clostridia bacterium]
MSRRSRERVRRPRAERREWEGLAARFEVEEGPADGRPRTVHEYVVAPDEAGLRLDRFLALKEELDASRATVQAWIAEGLVQLNGYEGRRSDRLEAGDRVRLEVPEPEPVELPAQPIPLDIVYEDHDIIVVNKQRGLVVHPAAGNASGTLVNALLAHCRDLSGIRGVLRPGIVHRIDKDTTGLLVVAKTDRAHAHLARQIRLHLVTRTYLALVKGWPPADEGAIDAPIGRDPSDRTRMAVRPGHGKPSVTRFRVVEKLPGHALLECRLETGRTHQIRVHLAYMGNPIVGDPVYAKGPLRPGGRESLGLGGQALHAFRLELRHPTDGRALTFEAPLPEDFREALRELRERARDGGSGPVQS